MSQTLVGKAAVITGGASGIGFAIAKLFVENGATVVLLDVNVDVKSIAKGLSSNHAYGLQVDLMAFENYDAIISQIFSHVDAVDILVNNAGLVKLEPAISMSCSNWDSTINLNLKSPFLMSQNLARYMTNQGSGKIVNLASQAAVVALDQHLSYCVSKAGIVSMTKVMALEWAGKGIQVNCISPTVVMTELGKKAWAGEKGEEMLKKIPVGRFAEPEDVAQVALFLASSNANMITGENIVVDGGYTIQ